METYKERGRIRRGWRGSWERKKRKSREELFFFSSSLFLYRSPSLFQINVFVLCCAQRGGAHSIPGHLAQCQGPGEVEANAPRFLEGWSFTRSALSSPEKEKQPLSLSLFLFLSLSPHSFLHLLSSITSSLSSFPHLTPKYISIIANIRHSRTGLHGPELKGGKRPPCRNETRLPPEESRDADIIGIKLLMSDA